MQAGKRALFIEYYTNIVAHGEIIHLVMSESDWLN